MADARKELTRLPEDLAASPATITVTRRGKPVLAILTWDDYESISETLEVLTDDEALTQLRDSLRDLKAGRTLPWEDAKASL
jgi:prevent-host-death family protein